jgi:hypothetical protein
LNGPHASSAPQAAFPFSGPTAGRHMSPRSRKELPNGVIARRFESAISLAMSEITRADLDHLQQSLTAEITGLRIDRSL